MDSSNFNAETSTEVDSLGQNGNSQTEIVIDVALCEICAPSSLMSPPLSPEHQEEMQDAVSTRRRSVRSRKVISSSEDDMTMPMSRSRTASNTSKRGRATSKRGVKSAPNSGGRAASRSKSRSSSRKSGGRAASRSKSRTRKSSTSRRGRRA